MIPKRILTTISLNRNLAAAIVLFGLILICLLWSSFIERMQTGREDAINHAKNESVNFARAFEEHILQALNRSDHLAMLLKYEYEAEGPQTDIFSIVRQAHLGDPPIVLLSVANETGDVILSSQNEFVPSNIKDREHFMVHQKSDNGQLFISDPVLGRSSGKWSVQMTRRLNKPDGSFDGVVVASIDPLYFVDFYKQTNVNEEMAIALVKPSGMILAAKTEDHALFGQTLKEFANDITAGGDSGGYITDNLIDPTRRIYSHHSLSDYPLSVFVGISEKKVLERLDERQKYYFMVSVLLTLFISIACGLLISMLFRRQRLEKQLREQEEETKREAALAARLQREDLPQPFTGSKVRVGTVFAPYHTVSSNLVNYKWFNKQQKLLGYVVDVCSHGVATALHTVTIKMLLDSRLLGGKKIDEQDFQFINRTMIRYLNEKSFAALLYFEFDFASSILTVISGGINLFFVAKPQKCALVPVYSCHLGLLDNAKVKTLTIPFTPGEIYGMISDGASDLIEAHGIKGQQGFEKYLAYFEELAHSLDRSDDFSAVCVEILPEPYDTEL